MDKLPPAETLQQEEAELADPTPPYVEDPFPVSIWWFVMLGLGAACWAVAFLVVRAALLALGLL